MEEGPQPRDPTDADQGTSPAVRGNEEVRAAEIVAALSLGTDLGIGVPLEHGLQSTLVAARLCERLGVDSTTAAETFYGCLLFYVGCTATAGTAEQLFGGEPALTRYMTPSRFGPRPEQVAGMLRALAPPGRPALVRAAQLVRGLPKLSREFKGVVATICEVGQMLTERLGLPSSMSRLFADVGERWDGKGQPRGIRGDEISLSVRIVHVARDAAFQAMLVGSDTAARVVRNRAGGAFDPSIAVTLADHAEILDIADSPTWEMTLAAEPGPRLTLEGDAIDRALAGIGDFADLISPYLVGHSRGVAELAAAAAEASGYDPPLRALVRRAALVHDLGRVAVPVRTWEKPGRLSSDEWEGVRLHAYHSERLLSRSPFLGTLSAIAGFHHERLDGSGYHRGATAATQTAPSRLLAATDAYHAMREPRPQRHALSAEQAAAQLEGEARAGRLAPDAVAALLAVSGQTVPKLERPAGLTQREAEVVGLLARGLQTKQVARALGISMKTADRHIQNAYGKMGVSTRAAAALFAMEHGIVAWGELPITGPARRL